jgi:hypothetical protein
VRPRLRARENLKDHRNFFAGTAGDYSTTFRAACKDRELQVARYFGITPGREKKSGKTGSSPRKDTQEHEGNLLSQAMVVVTLL